MGSVKMQTKKDEVEVRDNWGGRFDAILSYIGFCVGLGNIWRFPYLCYRNGGGAFLIPYFLTLFLTGLPLYFMEMSMGQYCSGGVLDVWNISPLFKGIGYTTALTTMMCLVYYIILIAYVIFYLCASFTSNLPWTTCDNEWNTPNCFIKSLKNDTLLGNVYGDGNLSITDQREMYTLSNSTYTSTSNTTLTSVVASPAQEYWENYVLMQSDGIDDFGSINWRLLGCNVAAWVITFLCLIKGIRSTGKVVYVTATLPYIVLTVLLVRGLTLPGSFEGLKFYLVPDFSKLLEARVWGDAASQIFYSLGPCWGMITTYGSYNKFNTNTQKDSTITAIACCLTSTYAGCVIFAVIGFLAHEMNQPIEKVMSSGPGLVFIVYPEAITRMPFAPFWSILFFLMVFTVALDSMFGCMEVIISMILDSYPKTLGKHRIPVTIACCVVMFIIGLPQLSQAGIYVLTLIDWYSCTFPLLVIGFSEVVVVSFVYGYDRWLGDLKLMLGFTPSLYWKITTCCVTPLVTVFIIVFNAAIYTPVSYGDYIYPKWAEMIGWFLCLFSLMFIPIYMIIHIHKTTGLSVFLSALCCPWTGEVWKKLTSPSPKWCPYEERIAKQKGFTGEELTELVDNGIVENGSYVTQNGECHMTPIYTAPKSMQCV